MKSVKVESRKDPFVKKARTAIWKETSTADHPYVVRDSSCYGYSIETLIEKGYSQTDMLFLLLRGELPTSSQRQLLDALSVALSNPGPRHPATRSVMEAAVSKTRSPHLLPIGLMVLGGDRAAGSVEGVMRFLRQNKKTHLQDLVNKLLNEYQGPENDLEIAPGFGPHFEKREPLYINLAKTIQNKFKNIDIYYLDWCLEFDQLLIESGCGLKASALAGAVLLDLGFHPRSGPPLFQLLATPGLLAHGLEMLNKPLTSMPFVTDENYHHLEVMS